MLEISPFMSPYGTTALKGMPVDQIDKQIKHNVITQTNGEYVAPLKDPSSGIEYVIYGVLPQAEQSIQAFNQPLIAKIDDIDRVVIDVRPYSRANRIGELNITSKSDYKFYLNYACLVNSWVNNGQALAASIAGLPGKVFTSWVGNAITRLLSLDAQHQIITKAIAGMYFECLFERIDPDEFGDRDKRRINIAVSKYIYLNSMQTSELLDNVSPMNSIEEFVDELKKQSELFQNLTVANLYAAVARSWFGPTSSTLTSVALEYPPALYVMIDYALNHAGFNKTAIGNIVWNDRHSTEARSFNSGIARIYSESEIR